MKDKVRVHGEQDTLLSHKATELTDLFDSFDREDLAGGYAAAVLKGDQIIFNKCYGVANHEYEIPFTAETVFDYASLAKQFTGLCFAHLILEDQIDLEDDIRAYLPELPEYGHTIRLRHLLGHTSGLRDWFHLAQLAGRSEDDSISERFLSDLLCRQKALNFVPGSRFAYSNSGYFLLAKILERLTGQPLRADAEENIFAPLDMKSTFFLENEKAIVKNRAMPYYRDQEGIYRQGGTRLAAIGSSSLFSSLDDMISWAQYLDAQIVGQSEHFELMLSPTVLNDGSTSQYNFGFAHGHWNELACLGHGGSWNGFACELVYFPVERVSILFMTNRTPNFVNTHDAVRQIMFDVAEMHPDEPKPHKGENKTTASVAAEWNDDILGEYVYRCDEASRIYHKANLKRVDGELVFRSTWLPEMLLAPEGQGNFRAMGTDFHLSFQPYGQEPIEELVVRGGENFILSHVRETIPPEVETAGLPGTYFCEDVLVAIVLSVEDGRLVMKHLVHEDVVLAYIGPDTFLGDQPWCEEIVFSRDQNHNFDGFLLSANSGNMMMNVRFEKYLKGDL